MSISKHLQDKLALLPDAPGCYIMKDENQNILYVGKAKVLKNRVRGASDAIEICSSPSMTKRS